MASIDLADTMGSLDLVDGPASMARRSSTTAVATHVERVATRAARLGAARDALVAAERSKAEGNALFKAGDFSRAGVSYAQAIACLDPALREPATAYGAECAMLTLLSNTAQVALRLNNPGSAAKFCRDALALSVCTHKEAVFKKVLVRLAVAMEASGGAEGAEDAYAVVHEAQLRGLDADELRAIARRAKKPQIVGALREGVEMRMFIMLALRLSAGQENVERMRGLLQTGDLPHVDRRDEVGNNVLWGVLNALTMESEEGKAADPNDNRGGEACVPMLTLLLSAGADPGQRYDGGRTPLMYAASSGLPDAARAVLTANTNQTPNVNAADAEGWTALHVACSAVEGHVKPQGGVSTREAHAHHASGYSSGGCGAAGHVDEISYLAIVRELLDAGADPAAQNDVGTTPLMLAAQHGACELVAELLRENPNRPGCGPELLRQRNKFGMSAVMIAHRTALKTGVVSDLVRAAEKAGGEIETEVREDIRMMKWQAAIEDVKRAHNEMIRRLIAEGPSNVTNTPYAAALAERTSLATWLGACGFDELPGDIAADAPEAARAALDAYGDVYSAIHRHVSDIAPAVITKAFLPGALPTDAEAGLLWYFAGGGDEGEQDSQDLPPEVQRGARPKVVDWNGEAGGVTADMDVWQKVVGQCMHHCFAFALPSTQALDAIAGLGVPVVEMGAGTGYWAALLRQRGVDVLAFDRYPPRAVATNDTISDGNLYFQATFTDVAAGAPKDLAAHAERALLLCWPYNPNEAELRGDAACPWDVECLDHWKGSVLVHVGEWVAAEDRDGGGGIDDEFRARRTAEAFPRGTTSKHRSGTSTSGAFQARVEKEFKMVKWVKLPNWPFVFDDLTVWQRR